MHHISKKNFFFSHWFTYTVHAASTFFKFLHQLIESFLWQVFSSHLEDGKKNLSLIPFPGSFLFFFFCLCSWNAIWQPYIGQNKTNKQTKKWWEAISNKPTIDDNMLTLFKKQSIVAVITTWSLICITQHVSAVSKTRKVHSGVQSHDDAQGKSQCELLWVHDKQTKKKKGKWKNQNNF